MKKILLGMIIASNICLAGDSVQKNFLEEISPKKTTIISGLKEAKQNVQTYFTYDENALYTIYCRVNYLTAIMMQPGEKINWIGGGDTARWKSMQQTTGSEEGQRDVVYLKPISVGLNTNIIINTNKRTYNIKVISAQEWFNPVVKFLYPQEEMKAKFIREEQQETMTLIDPSQLNYGYTVNTKKYSFVPGTIFDDGKKTFLVMKDELQEMPAFYIKEGKSLLPVNYRIKGNYLIVDRIFDEAVLRMGDDKHKQQVIIKRKKER